ncbi:jg17991 [Pararge aegeria aegeria]|uniref:Jg17991 protein n=1 Tax=Pararge aegeria aegeria TaxID=348720 RepID=A0A8S4S340_9NEOP|nr:jg17991 [Pararge aegeria aegeria]
MRIAGSAVAKENAYVIHDHSVKSERPRRRNDWSTSRFLVAVEFFVTEPCLFLPLSSIVAILCSGLMGVVAGAITGALGLEPTPQIDGHRA